MKCKKTLQCSGQLYTFCYLVLYLKFSGTSHMTVQFYPVPLTYDDILVLFISNSPDTDTFGCIVKLGQKCFMLEF